MNEGRNKWWNRKAINLRKENTLFVFTVVVVAEPINDNDIHTHTHGHESGYHEAH